MVRLIAPPWWVNDREWLSRRFAVQIAKHRDLDLRIVCKLAVLGEQYLRRLCQANWRWARPTESDD